MIIKYYLRQLWVCPPNLLPYPTANSPTLYLWPPEMTSRNTLLRTGQLSTYTKWTKEIAWSLAWWPATNYSSSPLATTTCSSTRERRKKSTICWTASKYRLLPRLSCRTKRDSCSLLTSPLHSLSQSPNLTSSYPQLLLPKLWRSEALPPVSSAKWH